MKKRFYFLLLFLLITISISLVVIYYAWNKPHEDIEHSSGIQLTATDLFRAFSEQEKQATEKYSGKVLEVTGIVSAVTVNQQGNSIISLQSDDLMFGINCTMEKATTVKKGSTVTIKGLCSGFTTDVILIRCYLINKQQ
ncbi:MAG: hypothetical protein GXC73_03915 [Chitinophagaceae bacterium]|nr:hypothetical protein [Chitinophagaceae bacterium]